jgi:hypothetical protein
MTNDLLIEGDNIHVFKYVDAAPLEIVCATTMSLRIVNEIIGATTPDSGYTKEKRVRLQEYFIALSGAMTSDNDGDISIFYLQNGNREVHDLEIVYTDNAGSDRTFRGNFLIEEQIMNGNAGEAGTFDLSMVGTGPYTESELTDPTVDGESVTSDSFTIASGVVQNNAWIGLSSANIIEVCREGTEQLSMNLPYTFDGVTGTITPDPATTIDGQKLFVIWTF